MELNIDPVVEPDPLADQRMPYLNYLLLEVLPMDKMEARRLTHHAKSFIVIEGSSTSEATPVSYSTTSPSNKGSSF